MQDGRIYIRNLRLNHFLILQGGKLGSDLIQAQSFLYLDGLGWLAFVLAMLVDQNAGGDRENARRDFIVLQLLDHLLDGHYAGRTDQSLEVFLRFLGPRLLECGLQQRYWLRSYKPWPPV